MPAGHKAVVRKVCGLTTAADAGHAIRAGANAVGMIFYPPSPRSVSIEQAKEIATAVPPGVRRVGVFVNESSSRIADIVGFVPLDVAQMHGDETPEDCMALRDAASGVEIWKAFRVGPDFDPDVLVDYNVDAVLLDTAKAGQYGGTGETFAWERVVSLSRSHRLILSGGLGPSNVVEAIRAVEPWGVDASSKLESEPGRKDPERVTQFLLGAI